MADATPDNDAQAQADSAKTEDVGDKAFTGVVAGLTAVGLTSIANFFLQAKQNKAVKAAKAELKIAQKAGTDEEAKLARNALNATKLLKNRAGILRRGLRLFGQLDNFLRIATMRVAHTLVNAFRVCTGRAAVPFVEGAANMARLGRAAFAVEFAGGMIGWDVGGAIGKRVSRMLHLGPGATGAVTLAGQFIVGTVGAAALVYGAGLIVGGLGLVGAPAFVAGVAIATVAYEGYQALRSGYDAWKKNGGYISFKSPGDFVHGITKGFGGDFWKDSWNNFYKRSGVKAIWEGTPKVAAATWDAVTHPVRTITGTVDAVGNFFTHTIPNFFGFGGAPKPAASPPQPAQSKPAPPPHVAASKPVAAKPNYTKGAQKPTTSAAGLRAATVPTGGRSATHGSGAAPVKTAVAKVKSKHMEAGVHA